MNKILALIGNPNCGKTTLFNTLTGSNQYVGNWPGVTVERKIGKLMNYEGFDVMDLPGVYSLSPYTPEEVVTRDYLLENHPGAVINILDASNLERNLYLTSQILEQGYPMVLALNMMDLVHKNGDDLDTEALGNMLGCHAIEITASKGIGIERLLDVAIHASDGHVRLKPIIYSKMIEITLKRIDEICMLPEEHDKRWRLVKIFERDPHELSKLTIVPALKEKLEALIQYCEQVEGDDSESLIAAGRYAGVEKILAKCYHRGNKDQTGAVSDRIDKVLTNRVLGLPIFLGIMWLMYYVCVSTVGAFTTDGMESLFKALAEVLGGALAAAGVSQVLIGLVCDGIIGGVGSVLSFVPQIFMLFFFLSFLEDCGYMSRVAFLMDRIFRSFGLSGRSFIPMLIGTGCSVPAIMCARTIENDRDRKLTIMLTPFIPCNAKLPLFALFAAALFPKNSWIGPSMYLFGIVMVIVSGLVLKHTRLFKGEAANFVMEMPSYHWPKAKSMWQHTWERAKGFIIKAGTIIFAASAIMWVLQNFSSGLVMVKPEESMMADIGRFIAPVFTPLGFGTWQTAFAAIAGFVAKEVTVSTFGILAGVSDQQAGASEMIKVVQTMFTPASGYAFMVFILLASPCVAAVATIKREMDSWKWTLGALCYQTGLAYVIALIIYQLGSRL